MQNETFRKNLKTKAIQVLIEEALLRLFGHARKRGTCQKGVGKTVTECEKRIVEVLQNTRNRKE